MPAAPCGRSPRVHSPRQASHIQVAQASQKLVALQLAWVGQRGQASALMRVCVTIHPA
ncbi:MAG: hypothetical protein SF182_06140 [Deltaproteobacteria bacterium]|nr:hypothetical protein [Deltaproteobacteria bacterium]